MTSENVIINKFTNKWNMMKRLTNAMEGPARTLWQGFLTMALEGQMLKIGTHDGVFHCDEALACFMLQQLPTFRNSVIIRSRDPAVLETCDVVVDVGGEYNPVTHRYDHHQRGFEHTLSTLRPDIPNKNIRLSSAGLVYVHFGEKILEQILNNPSLGVKEIHIIYKAVYDGIIEEIDAIDNGIPMYDSNPRYRIATHLGARVHRLNPEWNSPPGQDLDRLFKQAMALVGHEFMEKVLHVANVWWPAHEIVQQAVENRFKVHESGKIIELTDRCPWKEHLDLIEDECGLKDDIKFVIFGDVKNSWRVQGIPVENGSFICRVFLKEEWRGVRDTVLTKVTGIPGCIFCHASGFIGGNQTREGALQMALESLID